jgi:hypothetical protein
MPSTVVKSVDSNEPIVQKKKLVKKASVKKETSQKGESSKVAEVAVVTEKKTKKVTEKKESKKEVEKKEPKEKKESSEEEKPKKKKDINVKPTLGDICGLNLSVAKVKNIISNNCINKEAHDALQILKGLRVFEDGSDANEPDEEDSDEVAESSEKKKVPKKNFTFNLEKVPSDTKAYLDKCYAEITAASCLVFSRSTIKEMSAESKAAYDAAKDAALADFAKTQKTDYLFRDQEFDLVKFNKEFKTDFYAGLEEPEKNWKSLTDMELYSHCVNILNKNKTRFNSEAKIYITAFVEYIIKQLIIHGTKGCIDSNKKIIKLEHALDHELSDHDFTMLPFITSTVAYQTYVFNTKKNEAEEEAESDDVAEDDVDAINSKIPYKHYIGELCRNVRMELATIDNAKDSKESKFNRTSVSKEFKQFCSDAIIELLEIFGNAIKVEVNTRNVKTVNYSIIRAVIYISHVLHNVKADNTIEFIQEKYNAYNEYLKKRESRLKSSATKE